MFYSALSKTITVDLSDVDPTGMTLAAACQKKIIDLCLVFYDEASTQLGHSGFFLRAKEVWWHGDVHNFVESNSLKDVMVDIQLDAMVAGNPKKLLIHYHDAPVSSHQVLDLP